MKSEIIGVQERTARQWALSGALAVALSSLASEALAVGWCPTSGDRTITCNSCSRELTCDVDGFGIRILGNSVTLDGRGYAIRNALSDGILATGSYTRIKNVNIEYPGNSGIFFGSTVSNGSLSTVENVTVVGAGGSGIYNYSAHAVSIYKSNLYFSGDYGVWANGSRYTDLKNSLVAYSSDGGYNASWTGSNSWVLNNTISANNSHGISGYQVTGMVFSGNTLNYNQGRGLYLYDVGGSVNNNNGHENAWEDCFETHFAPVTIVASGNSWGRYYGPGCGP